MALFSLVERHGEATQHQERLWQYYRTNLLLLLFLVDFVVVQPVLLLLLLFFLFARLLIFFFLFSSLRTSTSTELWIPGQVTPAWKITLSLLPYLYP